MMFTTFYGENLVNQLFLWWMFHCQVNFPKANNHSNHGSSAWHKRARALLIALQADISWRGALLGAPSTPIHPKNITRRIYINYIHNCKYINPYVDNILIYLMNQYVL